MAESVKVAIAQDALACFARMPDKVQKKVTEFMGRFMSNPENTGSNYETLNAVKDKNLCSVRFGDDYRGIVLKPASGNVYVLLWIDHHDEAYDWAFRHQCRVHPDTGALQVLKVDYSVEEPALVVAAKTVGLFDELKDRELRRIGLPEECIPLVRGVRNDDDLDRVIRQIPEEVSDALYQLASGFSYADVVSEIESVNKVVVTIDTDDFECTRFAGLSWLKAKMNCKLC